MKIIYPELQSTASATSASTSYPASNLLDNHQNKAWKVATAGKYTATLTITILAGGTNCIALFGTNASTAVCTIKDSGGSTVEVETHTLHTATRTYDGFWQEFTAQTSTCSAEIVLTASSATTLKAGVVRAGVYKDFRNPQYGLSESRKDYSIKKELNGGGYYTKKREIVRVFSVSIDMLRDTDFYNLSDIYDAYGPNPMAFLLAEDINDLQWCVFGHMTDPFDGSHDYYSDSTVAFTVEENL